jgi:hypothetical protein
VLEIHVRAGRIHPVVLAVPIGEKDHIAFLLPGPSGYVPDTGMVQQTHNVHNGWQRVAIHHAITPTESLYIGFSGLPSSVKIGELTPDRGSVIWEATLDRAQMSQILTWKATLPPATSRPR